MSMLLRLTLLLVWWSCDSNSGLLPLKRQDWAPFRDSLPRHRFLISGPEEERSPRQTLGQGVYCNSGFLQFLSKLIFWCIESLFKIVHE